MNASKVAEGYPDTSVYALFSNDENVEPVVDLKDQAELNGVDIHLAPPDGTLELDIIDKETGAVVQAARLTMRRADTHTFYSTDIRNGMYSTPLPDKPISIEISANGYQGWRYLSPRGAESIEIRSLEVRKIRVELVPRN
jgi:hypothetical protein